MNRNTKRCKNKRGTTLVEVICALAIIGLALVFGLQIFALAATGYMRGAHMARNAESVCTYFESGTQDANVQTVLAPQRVVLHFGGTSVDFGEQNVVQACRGNFHGPAGLRLAMHIGKIGKAGRPGLQIQKLYHRHRRRKWNHPPPCRSNCPRWACR